MHLDAAIVRVTRRVDCVLKQRAPRSIAESLAASRSGEPATRCSLWTLHGAPQEWWQHRPGIMRLRWRTTAVTWEFP